MSNLEKLKAEYERCLRPTEEMLCDDNLFGVKTRDERLKYYEYRAEAIGFCLDHLNSFPSEPDYKTELERAYRCIRGMYGAIANGLKFEGSPLAYHSPTLGAAIRFVDEGALDGSEFFIGKHISALHDALGKYRK
jgi:hypothetical protein